MELELDNIVFSYQKHFDVLKGVTAKFGPGIHLLLGPNGAGKTTLLKIIAGMLVPKSGECIIGIDDVANHSPRTIKDVFLLEDTCVFPLKTINEMSRLHAAFYPNFSAEQLSKNLAEFGMTGDEMLPDMSLGERHKANVAYALALNTAILMLDEPANGLDINSKQSLSSMIARAMLDNEERTIIIATHTVQEMRNLFDSVTILNHGEIVLNATTDVISERLAFLSDRTRRDDAIFFFQKFEGASQIVANDGTHETPIDYSLLFMAATAETVEQLKTILK